MESFFAYDSNAPILRYLISIHTPLKNHKEPISVLVFRLMTASATDSTSWRLWREPPARPPACKLASLLLPAPLKSSLIILVFNYTLCFLAPQKPQKFIWQWKTKFQIPDSREDGQWTLVKVDRYKNWSDFDLGLHAVQKIPHFIVSTFFIPLMLHISNPLMPACLKTWRQERLVKLWIHTNKARICKFCIDEASNKCKRQPQV